VGTCTGPALRLNELDSEHQDVHTTEDATKPPTLGRVAEPEGAYFPNEDLYFFDASPDAWLDRDDDDCFLRCARRYGKEPT
jgi:hypothetical protein